MDTEKIHYTFPIESLDQKYKDWLSGKEKPDLFYPSVLFPGLTLLFFFIALTLPVFLLYHTLDEESFRTSSWGVIAVVSLLPVFLLLHYWKLKRLIRLVKSGEILLGLFVDSESILCRVDERTCTLIPAGDIVDISLIEITSENTGGRRYELHINKNNPLLEIAQADFDFGQGLKKIHKDLNDLLGIM